MERNEILETFDPYSTQPELTLSSFSRRAEVRPAGLSTPPIHLSGAIPFGWEEAPGRPKQKPNQAHDAGSASAGDRRLGLPPRLHASSASSTRRAGRGGRPKAKRPISNSACTPHLSSGRKDRKEMDMRWDSSSEEKSSEDTPNPSSSSCSLKSPSTVSVCSHSNGGEERDVEEEADDQKREKEFRKVRVLRYKRKKRSLTWAATYSASRFWVMFSFLIINLTI